MYVLYEAQQLVSPEKWDRWLDAEMAAEGHGSNRPSSKTAAGVAAAPGRL